MDWRKRLQQAVELHQSGRLADAILAYRDVLTRRGDNSDALHLLGMALEQSGLPAQGQGFVELAVRNEPQVAAYRNSLGNIHRALSNVAAAREAYLAALERDPALAEAHDNLGLLDQAAGNWPAAIEHFKAALAANPQLLSARFNLAATEWLAGDRDKAAAVFATLLRVMPSYAPQLVALAKRSIATGDVASTEQMLALLGDALPVAERHFFAGALARQRGDMTAAEQAFRAALGHDPQHGEVLPLLAALLLEREAYDEAIPLLERRLAARLDDGAALVALVAACSRSGQPGRAIPLLRQALATRPDDATILAELAQATDQAGQTDEACDLYARLIALQPKEAIAYANLAALELQRGNIARARQLVEKALALRPDSATALGNLANIHALDKEFDAAIAIYRQLIARRPDDASSHNNLALLLLRLGRYAEAWPHFAWRWKSSGWTTPDRGNGLPRWDVAKPMPGRVLLWREQGIGDEILYASLLPEMAERGTEIVLATDPRLVPLFSRSFPQIRVVADDATLQPATLDLACQAPLGDIAGLLRPDAASFARQPVAYLKADPERAAAMRARYADNGRLLVGLSWTSRNRRMEQHKSLALADMAPFLREPDTQFISLQYGAATDDIAALRQQTGLDLLHDPEIDPLRDIDAQAAQIAGLDLVVTVSTAAAHLAAALGVPTLILLPGRQGQLWYWGEAGETTPWYRSVRLCRTGATGCGHTEGTTALIERALTMFRAMRAAVPQPGTSRL